MESFIIYVFFVEQWFSLDQGESVEAVIEPASYEDINSFERVLSDNIVCGLQHFHVLSGIITQRSYVRMARLDRIVLLLTLIMVTFLMTIAFYKRKTINYPGVDSPEFTFEMKDYWIGVSAMVGSALTILIVELLFSRSYNTEDVKIYGRGDGEILTIKKMSVYLNVRKSGTENETNIQTTTPLANITFYERLVRLLRKVYKPMPFLPITLSEKKTTTNINNKTKVIALVFSITLILISAYFIMIYGLRLGYEDSKIWLTSSFIALAQKFMIITPLKVIIVATILASIIKPLTPVYHHKIKVEDFNLNNLTDENQQYEYCKHVLELRKHSCYNPLPPTKVERLRKRRAKKKLIFKVYEFITVLTYIILLITVIEINFTHETYILEEQVNLLILTGTNEKTLRFSDIINRTELLEYMSYTFTKSENVYSKGCYSTFSFNCSDSPQFQYWSKDCTMKMVGPPMIRQMRLARRGCSFNSIFKNVSLACIPSWSSTSADEENHGYRWGTIGVDDNNQSKPRAFTHDFEFEVEDPESPTGINYPEGGYVVKLSTRPDITRRVLLDLLFLGKWIDHLSRVVFIDLAFYNTNKNTFTQLKLIIEHLPYGLHVTRSNTDSVKLNDLGGFWNTCFTILIFTLTVGYALNLNHDV